MNQSALSINLHGRIVDFIRPKVMGIVNITPDSFYAGSRTPSSREIGERLRVMADAGVDIFDIGGYSTRPGADDVPADEEYSRLARALEIIKRDYPEIPVSVDTFRASVADRCIAEGGADIINDVAGGTLDPEIFDVAAERKVPYILMHLRGTPATMQSLCDYEDVTTEVIEYLARKADILHSKGVADVILDPGFGFAKTVEQNYRLLSELQEFKKLGMPVLAGLSRKSMIWKPLGITPADSLPGTLVLHAVAIMKGADIIRVHDVAEAVQTVKVLELLKENTTLNFNQIPSQL